MVTNFEYATPVTFCEIFPPDNFPLWFYRKPTAPDMQVTPADIDFDAVRGTAADVAVGDRSERGAEPGVALRGAGGPGPQAVHGAGSGLSADVLGRRRRAATEQVQKVLPHVTVAVGNREECEVAVGETEPERAADALLDAGVELAVVKQGPKGVLAKTRTERVESPPIPIKPLNGLGAGDSFGGSLCHGLLAGWPLEKVLQYANAAGAIVASRLECSTAMPTEAEIETLIAGGDPNERLADSLRRATSRARASDDRRDRPRRPPAGFAGSVAEINEIRARDPQPDQAAAGRASQAASCSGRTAG